MELDPDENPWSEIPQEFILPRTSIDWDKLLRLDIAVEVDYKIRFNKTYQAQLTFPAAGPLVLLLLDNRQYALEFTSGSDTIPGVISFRENFTLPYLLDPDRN
jgi:hypothetical protein